MEENEAYWAGLIVAVIMLGSGFSLLLFPTHTGYDAVILSLGMMTMILVLMTKTLITQIQKWMDYNARIEETVSNILALRKEEIKTLPQTVAATEPEKAKVEENSCLATVIFSKLISSLLKILLYSCSSTLNICMSSL